MRTNPSDTFFRRLAYLAIGALVAASLWVGLTAPTGWGLAWGDAAPPGGGIIRDR